MEVSDQGVVSVRSDLRLVGWDIRRAGDRGDVQIPTVSHVCANMVHYSS